MNYKQAINYLESFIDYEKLSAPPAKSPFQLDRVRKLLENLGNPQEKFTSVHIAGTNGKGSTAAMAASIFSEAGIRTGLYTSPHLITFRERIRINGRPAGKKEIASLTGQVRDAVLNLFENCGQPSFFEVYTALGFLYFARQGVETAVIETGLGGRLDATNVILPSVSLITPISYDHSRELGNSLTEIAGEKSGIIKPGIPVISAPQEEEAAEVIRKKCRDTNSPLTEIRLSQAGASGRPSATTFFVETEQSTGRGNLFTLKTDKNTYKGLYVPMPGTHQALNAGLAACAASLLGVGEKDIKRGLEKIEIPGRLQLIPGRVSFLLDGGHNPAAARILSEHLKTRFSRYSIILVFGASADKDCRGIAKEIFPLADEIILTKSCNPRAADPAVLREKTCPPAGKTQAAGGCEEAIKFALGRSTDRTLICVTGSFFLVGEALAVISRGKTSEAPGKHGAGKV